jgi:hypothetical protein
MGRYIDWADVIDRYPELNTLGGADQLSSSYIVYGEAHVDGMLSNHYTVPFSNNNMIIRDLAIDYVYWRAARFKFEDATMVKSAYFETIGMVNAGTLVMIDDAGTVIAQTKKKIGLHSTTESYHSAFGIRDPIDWHIDEDQITDEQGAT